MHCPSHIDTPPSIHVLIHTHTCPSTAGTCITSDDYVTRDIFYNGNVINERVTIISRIAPTFLRWVQNFDCNTCTCRSVCMYGNTCHQHSKVPREELAIGFSWRWRGQEVVKLRSPYTANEWWKIKCQRWLKRDPLPYVLSSSSISTCAVTNSFRLVYMQAATSPTHW